MEFKGTRGVWKISQPFEGTITIGGNVKVLVLPYSELKGLQTEDIANALLISKAPEMLQMLKNYLSDLENIVPDSTARNSRIEDIRNLIKEATEI